jgi:AraC-like DNA-binding protein
MLLSEDRRRRLCRARDLLREWREPAPSIRQIARELRISPFHFIRQFDATFGVTPHQFRIQSRLDHAKQLLAFGRHTVTDVCLEVGFSSLGSFSTLFTRRFGEPPSAYRRRVWALTPASGTLRNDLTPGCLTLMSRLPAGAFARPGRNSREAPAARIGHTRGKRKPPPEAGCASNSRA